MKRTFTITLLFAAITFMSFVIDKDPPRYKNLKVLSKNISKEQLDSLMHHFSASLGVRCNYCHEYNQQTNSMDFASDAKKEKATAREMWQMTAKINKKFFEVKDSKNPDTPLEVTCFTCHRGSDHPETKAPMRHMGPPPPPGQGHQPGDSSKMTMDSTKH